METSEDKQWASKYLLDPLNAPQPADETGPGTSFIPQTSAKSSNPGHKKATSVSTRPVNPAPEQNRPQPDRLLARATTHTATPPMPPPDTHHHQICHPRKDRFSHRSEAFPNFDGSYSPSSRRSVDQASTQIPTSTGGQQSSTTPSTGHRRRTSSLSQRYPGDQTYRSLDMLKQDAKIANRAPHLRKKNQVGADSIDRLDDLIGQYHHEGPYDATLLARNNNYTNSPVEAVSSTNEEALKATPRELIKDSVEKHRPLDGVAMVPPGKADRYGNIYNYQEGTDMMIENGPEGGAYKRWPGVKYLPNDLKGKSEPSYSLEKALKEHKLHDTHDADENSGIEMTTPAQQRRPMSTSSEARPSSADGQKYADWEGQVKRSGSGAGKLRKRFGSLSGKGHKSPGSR